jgi:multiple antibiotic resistance protein
MDIEFLIKVFGALFAISNPFANLPVFLSLTDGRSPAEVRKAAIETTFYSTLMCVVVALAGQQILSFFGIGVEAFRLAGGLVILAIGLGMLEGRGALPQETHGPGEAASQDIAFYPMAFPMVIGPGTISTLIVFLSQATGEAQVLSFWVAMGGLMLVTGIVLSAAPTIGRHMSQKLRVIMTRLMGMILAAIAVEMITGGLKSLLPGLG